MDGITLFLVLCFGLGTYSFYLSEVYVDLLALFFPCYTYTRCLCHVTWQLLPLELSVVFCFLTLSLAIWLSGSWNVDRRDNVHILSLGLKKHRSFLFVLLCFCHHLEKSLPAIAVVLWIRAPDLTHIELAWAQPTLKSHTWLDLLLRAKPPSWA